MLSPTVTPLCKRKCCERPLNSRCCIRSTNSLTEIRVFELWVQLVSKDHWKQNSRSGMPI
eukprot:3469618-Rhodomonas_salina.1